MIPPKQVTAKLSEKTQYTDKFFGFEFELTHPHVMTFEAGQYVSIQVAPTGERRSYSICSTPAIDHSFELLVDISPNGLGANFLKNLKIGDEVNVLGPLGHFTLSQSGESAIALVATGSGIAPLRSMILDLLQNKGDTRQITLYWGLRYAADMFWLEDLEDLAEKFSNFHFYPTLSQPAPEWTLSSGRVTDLLQVHKFTPKTGFYLCGNAPMMKDATNLLLAKGVESSYIHQESFVAPTVAATTAASK